MNSPDYSTIVWINDLMVIVHHIIHYSKKIVLLIILCILYPNGTVTNMCGTTAVESQSNDRYEHSLIFYLRVLVKRDNYILTIILKLSNML